MSIESGENRRRANWTQPVHGFRATRRRLPHREESGRVHFVTFRTKEMELPPVARDIVLHTCLTTHGVTIDLHAVVVMPDHVHLLLCPLAAATSAQGGTVDPPVRSLAAIAHSIKSFSAHAVNRALGRRGAVWQSERWDRIVRDEKEYREKLEYISNNPVKRGLVNAPDEYRWMAFPEAPGE